MYDEVYSLPAADAKTQTDYAQSVGAAQGEGRLLVLSTCTDTDGRDKRLLVFAVLEDTA